MNDSENGFDEMVAIQMTIHSWPGQAKLSAEDLGLNEGEVPEIFHLGNKKLYPQEWRTRFSQVANRARNYLYDQSYPFMVESVRAIPARNLARVEERLEELKAEYLAMADKFGFHYEAIQRQWQGKYPAVWPRLQQHYPTKSQVRKKFDFDWNVFVIKGAEIREGSAPEIIEAHRRAKEKLEARYAEMVEEAVVYLRKQVLEVATNLMERLKDGRIVRNETLESVRRVEGWFKDLNIFGDRNVESSLKQLREALNGTDYEQLKDNDLLKKKLAGLADGVVAAASEISDVSKISGNYRRRIDLS